MIQFMVASVPVPILKVVSIVPSLLSLQILFIATPLTRVKFPTITIFPSPSLIISLTSVPSTNAEANAPKVILKV